MMCVVLLCKTIKRFTSWTFSKLVLCKSVSPREVIVSVNLLIVYWALTAPKQEGCLDWKGVLKRSIAPLSVNGALYLKLFSCNCLPFSCPPKCDFAVINLLTWLHSRHLCLTPTSIRPISWRQQHPIHQVCHKEQWPRCWRRPSLSTSQLWSGNLALYFHRHYFLWKTKANNIK
jgi:hypothetical protein